MCSHLYSSDQPIKTEISTLPIECLEQIFGYLDGLDRLMVAVVCKKWHEILRQRAMLENIRVLLDHSVEEAMRVMARSTREYSALKIKEADPSVIQNTLFWSTLGPRLDYLEFQSCDLSERALIAILSRCPNLSHLSLTNCNGLLIAGTLLNDESDRELIRKCLQNVTCLSLSDSRYLTDAIFNRFIDSIGALKCLEIDGCNMNFHPAVFRRMTPTSDTIVSAQSSSPSPTVFTFQNVLTIIKKRNISLERLNMSRSFLSAAALAELVEACPQLTDVCLASCHQLTKSMGDSLAKLGHLTVLDLSSNTQVNDLLVIAVCHNLHNLQDLNLAKCHGITDVSANAIGTYLAHSLRRLDLTSCFQVSPSGLISALGGGDDVSSNPVRSRQQWRALHFGFCMVNDKVAERIVECAPEVRVLDLTSAKQLTNAAIFSLVRLTKLRTLRLAWCRELKTFDPNEIFKYVASAERPEYVSFPPRHFGTCIGFPLRPDPRMPSNSQLVDQDSHRTLRSPDEQPSSGALSTLSDIRGLQHLDLCGCSELAQKLDDALIFNELRSLNLSLIRAVTDDVLANICRQNRALEELMVSQCVQLTDAGMAAGLPYLSRLRYLDLQACSLITDSTLVVLLNFCPLLRYVDASLSSMTSKALREFETKRPNLTLVYKATTVQPAV